MSGQDTRVSTWFAYPAVVNNTAARIVAAWVVALAVLFVVSGWWPVAVVLWAGFVARVASGPRLSPVARLATSRHLAGRWQPQPTPGPPKRFAQGVGAVLATAALVALALGSPAVATAVVAAVATAAFAEAALGFCLGCWAFGQLMSVGVVPARVCVECADISARLARQARQTSTR